jgi:hypothetical protein
MMGGEEILDVDEIVKITRSGKKGKKKEEKGNVLKKKKAKLKRNIW